MRKQRKPTQKEALDALLKSESYVKILKDQVEFLKYQLYWTNLLKNPCYEAERIQSKW